jgi:hypothetical protein
MNRDDLKLGLGIAGATIAAGGLLLYFLGARPRHGLAEEIIPVDEPTIFDWVSAGSTMYLV